MPEKLKRLVFDLEDRLFDLRHGIDTRGVRPPSVGAGPHAVAARHATAYQAVWTRNLRVLVREARRIAAPEVFVDIGSGKGKACIYAAATFRRVVGVEYDAGLVDEARRNQRRAGCHNIEFVLADATAYDLPAAPTLVFLFNPFDGVMLARFLEHNRDCLRAQGSVVAYANDLQRQALDDAGFACAYRDPLRSISLWR